jgi:hypothetical protein
MSKLKSASAALNLCANEQKRAGGWMPPATMLQRNPNEFEDLDDMERVRSVVPVLIRLLELCSSYHPTCC